MDTMQLQATSTIRQPASLGSDLSGDLATTLRPLYTQFLKDLNLQPLERFESDKLLEAVLEVAQRTGIPHDDNSSSFQGLMIGYSIADYCLPYHDLEVKVFMAIYTWFIVLCEEQERLGAVSDIELFQQRWIMAEKQPTIFLQAFADHLRSSYTLYHPLIANLIICSSCNLLTSTALAARDGIRKKIRFPSKDGNNFPWYMRERDGAGEAYAWLAFPKSQFPDLDVPIEAIEDISRFIDFLNDVLSFYKEVMGGEAYNYIQMKAAYDGGDILSTLRETAQDTIDCARRIENVLAGKGEYERAWRLYVTGMVQMHIMRGRYRLWEVGVGANPDPKEILVE